VDLNTALSTILFSTEEDPLSQLTCHKVELNKSYQQIVKFHKFDEMDG
jgi:hypothetical protein